MACRSNPDGAEMATAVHQDGGVRFWHAATGSPLAKRLRGQGGIAPHPVGHDRGRQIVTGPLGRTVRVWDAVRREELVRLTERTGIVWDAPRK